jgi:hypothetical protein
MSYSHVKFSTSFPSTKFIWGWVNAFFFAMLANNHPLSSGELTVRPLQMRLGRLVSTKNGIFSGSILIYQSRGPGYLTARLDQVRKIGYPNS